MIKRHSPYAGILHEVVEHNGMLHFCGVVGEDAAADIAGQMRSITQQIDALLAANGSNKAHILSTLIFITDMTLKPAMNEVWKAWLAPAHLPTRATIGVADLDGYLIEVVITAAVAR